MMVAMFYVGRTALTSEGKGGSADSGSRTLLQPVDARPRNPELPCYRAGTKAVVSEPPDRFRIDRWWRS
jgi:hypothetical protein